MICILSINYLYFIYELSWFYLWIILILSINYLDFIYQFSLFHLSIFLILSMDFLDFIYEFSLFYLWIIFFIISISYYFASTLAIWSLSACNCFLCSSSISLSAVNLFLSTSSSRWSADSKWRVSAVSPYKQTIATTIIYLRFIILHSVQ